VKIFLLIDIIIFISWKENYLIFSASYYNNYNSQEFILTFYLIQYQLFIEIIQIDKRK